MQRINPNQNTPRQVRYLPPTTSRSEVRSNVIPFPVSARGIRPAEALPAAPGEDGTPEIIPPVRQNIYLGVWLAIAVLVVMGRMAGLV